MVTAMVKRGGDFNPNNRGWEWLILDTDGKILQRGGDLFDNACNGCHEKNYAEDYVFTK
ncbi:MAG: hypothetical protein C0600_15885 [Ignavibacteria bacterium]|nr:MAG: hypothetical protein C0600_15885 [Ignavibacteria bacterium]